MFNAHVRDGKLAVHWPILCIMCVRLVYCVFLCCLVLINKIRWYYIANGLELIRHAIVSFPQELWISLPVWQPILTSYDSYPGVKTS